jgi:hypothetical protein
VPEVDCLSVHTCVDHIDNFSQYRMAELALAGTIIGLVATGAHLAVKVANFVQAVEDAPESIQDVRSELQAVNNILEQIKTPIENQPDSIPPGTVSDVAKNAKDCTRVFTQLNKLIDRLGRPNSKRQKFLFVFYADNIIAARSSLQAQKLSLSLTLQLALRYAPLGNKLSCTRRPPSKICYF